MLASLMQGRKHTDQETHTTQPFRPSRPLVLEQHDECLILPRRPPVVGPERDVSKMESEVARVRLTDAYGLSARQQCSRNREVRTVRREVIRREAVRAKESEQNLLRD